MAVNENNLSRHIKHNQNDQKILKDCIFKCSNKSLFKKIIYCDD